VSVTDAPFPIPPADEHNQRLVDLVDPAGSPQPEPAARYNLVVIGAGTAGLVTAAGAAGLGAKVALIERHLIGGDCLNSGCVPSKALLSAARVAATVRDAARFGVSVQCDARVDFAAIMERMRRVRADLASNDSAARFTGLGVDVFHGEARFVARDQVEVGGKILRFSRAAIATGARAVALPIAGLADAGFLTNETVFSLTAMPRSIAVIGAGPVGCELAQAFRRFGAEVTLLEVMPRILIREDPDAAERIGRALEGEGIEVVTEATITQIERRGGAKIIRCEHRGTVREIAVDEILIGAGRAPNIENLRLETAGVEYDRGGVTVDDHLRTTNHRVYAAGDVCTSYKFTHVADAMARVVIRNALFLGRARMSALTIPWCVYTDPEIAHVGLSAEDAARRGIRIRTFMQELAQVDRAVIDSETEGFVKVHVAEGDDRIVGATIVARHASEMISELTLAISRKVGLGAIANLIHPYPTQAEAVKKLGDAYNRTRLTPRVNRILEEWLAWRR
jgi:pyruvate/2-oxoglutarate dehydrogenase complex dihydrolipoamide dehydrogenase (E3) component